MASADFESFARYRADYFDWSVCTEILSASKGNIKLTETVQHYQDYPCLTFFPLVHPSPRNQIWMAKNPWFAEQVELPDLQALVQKIIHQ